MISAALESLVALTNVAAVCGYVEGGLPGWEGDVSPKPTDPHLPPLSPYLVVNEM